MRGEGEKKKEKVRGKKKKGEKVEERRDDTDLAVY